METVLKVHVSKSPPANEAMVKCKKTEIKKSWLKKLFGSEKARMTILIPGDNVTAVEIVPAASNSGGNANGKV